MLRVRCLGWTRKETSKEAKLHGRQCPLHASLRVTSFRGLSLDASQTWFRLLFFAFPRGKSIARHRGGFTRPSAERAHYTKPPRPKQARRFQKSAMANPTPTTQTETPYSYIVSLGRSTLSFQITHVLLESNRALQNKPGSVSSSRNASTLRMSSATSYTTLLPSSKLTRSL